MSRTTLTRVCYAPYHRGTMKRTKNQQTFTSKPSGCAPLTEEALRKDFDSYRKLVHEIGQKYRILPTYPEISPESGGIAHTSELVFLYQVHASM